MDPVFIAAYLLNPIIYFRNLYFIYKKKPIQKLLTQPVKRQGIAQVEEMAKRVFSK